MLKNIVIIQNTEIGWHLALSVFLTGLLKKYIKNDQCTYSLICGKIEDNRNLWEIPKNIDVHTTNTWLYSIKDNIAFSLKSFYKLFKIHRSSPIHSIHAFYPNSSLLWAVFFKVFFSWKTRIIYDVRSPWIEMSFANNHISTRKVFIKYIMHFCEFILIRFVSEFVFITEGTRDYYIEKYKLNKTIKNTIIPSWVEVSDFQITISQEKKQKIMEEFRMKNSSQIIIWYVGTISKMRELDKFVAENNKIILESNYKLIFIGEGDWVNNLNKIIQENGLQENVLILGKKTRDVIPEYIQTFSYWLCHLPDIFVFRNSFPLKILEYLSAGKKVVLSNIDSHRELLGKFKWNLIIYNSQISSALSNENDSFVSSEINTYDWKNLALMYNFIYK